MTVNLSNSCNKYTSSKWVLEQTAGSRWTYKPPGRAKGPMKSRVAFEPPQVGGPVGFMGDSVRHRLLSLSVGWLSFKRRLSLLAGSESCFRSNQMCKALWTVQSVLLKESWLTEANQQGGGAVRVRLRTWDFQSSALFKRQEPSPCHQWDHRMSIGNVGSRLEAQDCVPSCPWRPRVWEGDVHVCLVCQQESMPFAVVGSDKEYQVDGKRVLGRKTPWGIIEGNSIYLIEDLAAGQLCLFIKHLRSQSLS